MYVRMIWFSEHTTIYVKLPWLHQHPFGRTALHASTLGIYSDSVLFTVIGIYLFIKLYLQQTQLHVRYLHEVLEAVEVRVSIGRVSG